LSKFRDICTLNLMWIFSVKKFHVDIHLNLDKVETSFIRWRKYIIILESS
jgi:hypothetical protein